MNQPLSQMLAIPARPDSLHDPEELLRRAEGADSFQLHSSRFEEEDLHLEICSDGELYQAHIFPTEFQIPELYRCQHLFPDVDVEAIENAQLGLGVEMEFGGNALASYHLQLKLICALVPDLLAVLDDSSEKSFPAAGSHWLPDPRWRPRPAISTRLRPSPGRRLRLAPHPRPEPLRLPGAGNPKFHQRHLSDPLQRAGDPGQPPARFGPEGSPRVWRALLPGLRHPGYSPGGHPGSLGRRSGALSGNHDRRKGGREEGHNENTCAVFVYPSEESVDQGEYSSLDIYDALLQDNPIYMITTSETNRMRALAAERLPFFTAAFADKRNQLLGKFSLLIDEEYRTEDNCREHIWFEILDIQEGRFHARLTQEPYYVSGVHEGFECEFGPEDLTDWLIFTPERRISPDDVYLLELS